MILALQPVEQKRAFTVGAIVALLGVSALMIRGGSPFLIGGLIAVLLAPAALYIAATRPLIFPYGLYVLLIPFDNLLGAGHFGTLTKFVGALSAVFLLFWTVRNRSLVALPPTVLPLFAFLVWGAASTLWALDQGDALAMLPTFAGLTFLYVALAITPLSTQQYRFLLYAVLVAGVIAAAYGALAFYRDPALSQQTLPNRRLVLQVADTIIDPNHFSAALIFPAAVAIMLALRARTYLSRIAFAASLCVMGIAIVLSGSRGGLLGVVVVVAYYLARSPRRTQLLWYCAAVGVAVSTIQSSMWLRLGSVFATGGSGRASIWSVGWQAFQHRWLAGYGIGNFPNAYDAYYLQVYQAYTNSWTSGPHSVPVRYLVETGIVGFVLLAWFFWEHFRLLRFVDVGSELFDYRLACEAALAGLLVTSLTLDTFHYKYMWLILAMLAQLRIVAMRSTMAETPRERLQLART